MAAELLLKGPKELPTGSQGVLKSIEWGSQGLPKGFQEMAVWNAGGRRGGWPDGWLEAWLAGWLAGGLAGWMAGWGPG